MPSVRVTDVRAIAEGLGDLGGGDAASVAPGKVLRAMVKRGWADLPAPGAGATLARWQVLQAVAAHDLSLVKLFEGHTDALATLAELGAPAFAPPNSTWGLWAAEVPQGRVVIDAARDDGPGPNRVRLTGRKCWCSGAAEVTHALLTAWDADGRGPHLVAVEMAQAGVRVTADGWQAVGMAGSQSVDVMFDGAIGHRIGPDGAYLSRRGFWHGGCGIAACWHGGARALAETLRSGLCKSGKPGETPFRWMALGQVDVALSQTAALLREAATWIDAHPQADANTWALRTRLAAEAAAESVLKTVGHALGAAPFCRDPAFARRAADLPVFIRQSHAERDHVALGERIGAGEASLWAL